ncbi:MAG: L,D-transpeptidase [Nitrospirae bacterium]|nr:L,D-transpeptidase [Nitrospirota bacterium]
MLPLFALFAFVFFFSVHPSLEARGADPGKPISPCRIHYPSDERVEWECRRLKRGETLENLFGDRWIDVARFNRIDRRHAWPGVALKVPLRLEEVSDFSPMPAEIPEAASEPRWILVDLSEQFLGAYEYGRLVFSAPIAAGEKENETPAGEFRITAYDRNRRSSLYQIEKTQIPYPMRYALRFHISRKEIAFWIHGRDVPGYPASHGCIGLYDEAMQKEYYGVPEEPVLDDAKRLFEWVVDPALDDGKFHFLRDGPMMRIIGQAPVGAP